MIPKHLCKPPAPNEIEVSLFGPGFGECILVHVGAGEWIIVDSCKSSDTGNPIALDYLTELGVDAGNDVSYLFCSHWHDDHIRGFDRLVEQCVSAKVVCSGALRSNEFLKLIAAYSDSDSTMMKSPGAKEIYSTLIQLEKRRDIPIWATKDRTIVARDIELSPENSIPFRVVTLSPSDHSITAAQLSFGSMLPQVYQPKRGLRSQSLNHSSVVTYVEIGEIGILLGGDLEVTGNQMSGWNCIINDRQIRTRRSFVYKVAHHGSVNGHHNSIWSDMLTNEPLSILTPFRNGSVALPKPQDINRLVSMRGASFITTPPEASGKTRRNRTVQRTIVEGTRTHSIWQSQTGQIRVRQSLGGSLKWTIDFSPSAYQLQSVPTPGEST